MTYYAFKKLHCPNCPRPDTAQTMGKFYTELKTINGIVCLIATCGHCKRSQIFPVQVAVENLGAVRHCGTNYYHKVLVNPRQVKVVCQRCQTRFYFKISNSLNIKTI